ncbi:MAG: hypothetical protein V4494_06520 [Chlamydiota bacterium]
MAILAKVLIATFLILFSCSGPQQSEQEKIRRQNAKGEFIFRKESERLYFTPSLNPHTREKYPWEDNLAGNNTRITKEYFRCNGSASNPLKLSKEPLSDCGGKQRHSLPLQNNKEFIYPILIDLLNYLQQKTGKKVIITCGHRCPTHNTYADDSTLNQSSKHMIGAEVDFYLEGLEYSPESVINLIMEFYKTAPFSKGKKDYEEFLRYEKSDTNVSIPPWYNKEIMIKLYKKTEGRDFDNSHHYPYISIQVRFDRKLNERVIYTWQKAFRGYMRY